MKGFLLASDLLLKIELNAVSGAMAAGPRIASIDNDISLGTPKRCILDTVTFKERRLLIFIE